jgi:mannose-6-phosphate isomerase-like protein (cupin superfamily)
MGSTFVIELSDVDMLESPDGAMRDSVLVDAKSGAKGMSAGIVWVAPNSTIHEDEHEFDEVYYVIRGEADVVVEGVPHRMKAGNVVLIPAGRRHRVHNPTDEVFEIFWCIATSWENLERIEEELGKWPVVDAAAGWHLS